MSSSTSTYSNKDCDCVCRDEKQILLDTYKDISDKMWHIISQARENIQDSVDDFVAKQIGQLFQIVPVYKKAFEGLNVKTKAEFEKKASHYFRDQFVREEFDELIQNEREWDDLLKDVDKTLSSPDAIPLEEEFTQAGMKILIVSFGEERGAENWLTETKCPYDMVLDSERNIYKALGLQRSVSKVWSISCMVYYTEQLLLGRDLPKPMENIQDDPQQMGGDFILDKRGVLKMVYRSKFSSDRPTVDHLLKVITK